MICFTAGVDGMSLLLVCIQGMITLVRFPEAGTEDLNVGRVGWDVVASGGGREVGERLLGWCWCGR